MIDTTRAGHVHRSLRQAQRAETARVSTLVAPAPRVARRVVDERGRGRDGSSRRRGRDAVDVSTQAAGTVRVHRRRRRGRGGGLSRRPHAERSFATAVGDGARERDGFVGSGEKRADGEGEGGEDDAENEDTSGELMQDAERSHTSMTRSPSETWGEDDRATEPLPRKREDDDEDAGGGNEIRRTVEARGRHESVSVGDGAHDPWTRDGSRARVCVVGEDDPGAAVGALARAIDALSPVVGPVDGKRLSFSAVTPTSAGGGRAWTCDVSEDVSFGSVGESFDQTVEEEVVEEEGTFPTCDCGEENCTLVEMHARGGPFALPVRDIPSRSAREVTESIVETDEEREDDEESIAGTEVDDIESLGAAVDALELIDEESEDQTVVVDEVVLEKACIDDDVGNRRGSRRGAGCANRHTHSLRRFSARQPRRLAFSARLSECASIEESNGSSRGDLG